MRTFTNTKGLKYTFHGLKPYTRKNGTEMHLEVWHAGCAREGCTEPVEVSIPEGYEPTLSAAFGAVHCKNHKLTQSEVSARRVAAASAARTRITEAMLQELIAHRRNGLSCAALSLLYPATENHIRKITALHLI